MKIKLKLFLHTVWVCLLLASGAHGQCPGNASGSFTINSAIPESGTNFNTFNGAYNYISCGISGPVVFNVAPGIYAEQLIMTAIPGTSATNTVTFNGNGATIKFSSTVSGQKAVIKLDGADHIRFDSLKIDATVSGSGTRYGFGVQLMNGADSNVVRRCTILTHTSTNSRDFAGIVMSASATDAQARGLTLCDSNMIANNRISGGFWGITMVGNDADVLQNNVVINNVIEDFHYYGIYLSGNLGALIEGNDLNRLNRTASFWDFYGIYLTNLNFGTRISKNRIHDPYTKVPTTGNGFYGIFFDWTSAITGYENVVSNNLIYNVTGQGSVYGLYNRGSGSASYFHNTVVLDDPLSVSGNVSRGFFQENDATGIQFKNNIISIKKGGFGGKHVIYVSGGTQLAASNNDYYINGPNSYLGNNGRDLISLAVWQAATAQDIGSFDVDPLFVSVADANLVPRSEILDNKGGGVGITTDIAGAPRSDTPDLGAYEYSLPDCTSPPVAGLSTASPSNGLCLGSAISLGLTGQTLGRGQTIQWQYSTAVEGTYADLGLPRPFADTVIFATTTFYYRAAVKCGNNIVFSTPVLVSVNPAFLSGIYTINPDLPEGASNFQNFSSAVAALGCGITGFVTFNVAPGTYNEQIRIPNIAGSSPSSRVTFQSANGLPESVNLRYAVTGSLNYVVRLDSASNITLKNISITNTSTGNGRVVELTTTASNDSILNCIITTPPTTDGWDGRAAIFSGTLMGSNNVIKGNTVNNGSTGILLRGFSAVLRASDNVIDSNKMKGGYYQGIYTQYHKRVSAAGNEIILSSPLNGTVYGIFVSDCDSGFQFIGNKVTISNSNRNTYGMQFEYCEAGPAAQGRIANNNILAVSGNTADLRGMYILNCRWNNVVNNAVNIKTSGANSWGLHARDGGNNTYLNNTVYNQSTSSANNFAAFFEGYYWSGNRGIDARNNIFAHGGGGRAIGTTDFGYNADRGAVNTITSDYNMLYTAGPLLASSTNPVNATYATLQDWRNTTKLDIHSIAFKPAFISGDDVRPNTSDSAVWGMNGRGVHIEGNNTDKDNKPRPVGMSEGVPDLGAYEFEPTSVPLALIPDPVTPVAGGTQTYMMGTDTVMKVTWPATGNLPQSVVLRRYSGEKPLGLAAGVSYMYFHTDATVSGTNTADAIVRQYFIDPWMGTINDASRLRMGKTNAAGNWVVSPSSRVDEYQDILNDSVTYLGKFTGLLDPALPVTTIAPADSSNMGTRFWVGYGHHVGFNRYGNDQDMVLYFSAQQAAKVTVRVSGTPWVRTYSVPANSVVISDSIPKSGSDDARLNGEGLFNRGISITSDVPITATTRIGSFNSTGASLLLPVGSYGYDYRALTLENVYGYDAFSWAYVVAEYNNTVVEITPSNPTAGGRAAGVPFIVTLNKGDVYNIMGASYGNDTYSYDMTGSRFRAVANSAGKCLPFGVFSGSSHNKVNCAAYPANSGSSDNFIQQNFPAQAWGRKYLLTPTSVGSAADTLMSNIFKVAVNDPATVVRRNGVVLPASTLVNNFYYQFESDSAVYIEADRPVTVAQYTSTANSCDNTYGAGAPEMIYISPVEQGIKKAVLFRTSQPYILQQYVTLAIPTAGLPTLRIDNSNVFNYTYTVPSLPGYTVVVKRWDTTGAASLDATVIIESDSAFTAITYGMGWNKTYGYNAGTMIRNLTVLPSINNVLNTAGSTSDFTCAKTPFRVSTLINFTPAFIKWEFSKVPGLVPAGDVTQASPVATDTVVVNGTRYFRFTVQQDFAFTAPGTYTVPVIITDPSIDGCSNSMETSLTITVKSPPISDFTYSFSGCANDTIRFAGTGSNSGLIINRWAWGYSDATRDSVQNPKKVFTESGDKDVVLKVITEEGCVADTVKSIMVKILPVVGLLSDSVTICPGSASDTLRIQNPAADVTYNWYTTLTGGTEVFTGTAFPVTATGVYYAEGLLDGCTNKPRTRAVVNVYEELGAPSVGVDSAGVNFIMFNWPEVPGAVSYSVSTDGGATYITPSSGATGLTHTVSGLLPAASASIIVRANGLTSCQNSVSQQVTANTLPDQVYIPNAFTPNGDGRNDTWQVYGYVVRSIRVAIFNPWGEKIFESTSQQAGWDGTYKGKQQPVGVYIYVAKMTLADGSLLDKRGSINLVR